MPRSFSRPEQPAIRVAAVTDVAFQRCIAPTCAKTYGVEEVRPQAKAQAQVILRSAEKLHQAVGRLDGFNDAGAELHALRDLEDEGDRLNRDAVSALFASGEDAVAIIRWKDIHEQLEEAVDACENAADVLEAILVKNR